MSDRIALVLVTAAGLAATAPVAAQTAPPPAPAPIEVAEPAFPAGTEVLSVDGEPLGVLSHVEVRPAGERILHIRRPDGVTTAAPAVVASRGERAIVLEWTRAEFESGGGPAATAPVEAAEAPRPPPL
ncbi:hypothetical protein [uncultured Brevundimonas sp.]|uniref:hypothetical protein n=1 Tax=uncultured Brevundimonas sp. TaxID=213418 RepID=UPI0026145C98|nr:hypothetical protein [uncultured Brevundimonas sp.]